MPHPIILDQETATLILVSTGRYKGFLVPGWQSELEETLPKLLDRVSIVNGRCHPSVRVM